MKILRRIIEIALTAVLALAVILATALFLGILPREAYLVTSGSMSPEIPTGSLVITDTSANPEPGDIISYSINDAVVTHRLLEINPDGSIVTKGDNLDQVDPFPATTDDIIGEVTTVIPGAAPVLGFLTSPAGIFSSIMIALGGAGLLSVLLGSRKDDADGTADEATGQHEESLSLQHA